MSSKQRKRDLCIICKKPHDDQAASCTGCYTTGERCARCGQRYGVHSAGNAACPIEINRYPKEHRFSKRSVFKEIHHAE